MFPGRFLEEDGAQALKKLVGHDYVPGEVKGSMVSVPVYGDFDCVVTCNERLLVRLEGDTDVEAWRRRLMILEFLNVIPEEERIGNYAQILFAEEAPGILRKAVAGAIAHLAELEARGNFIETDAQKARVDHLLAESESVRYFVAERVLPRGWRSRVSLPRSLSPHTSTIAMSAIGAPTASSRPNALSLIS